MLTVIKTKKIEYNICLLTADKRHDFKWGSRIWKIKSDWVISPV